MPPECLRFKIDENLPHAVATILTEGGHDAHTVFQEHLQSTPDSGIVAVCRNEGRILVTLDLDFSDIRAYPPSEYPGFIVLRLRSHNINHITSAISRILGVMTSEPLANRTWIVEENRIRLHGETME